MTLQQIIFIIISLVTLGSAIIVVTYRNLFHAALAMMLSFLGVAGFYVTLDAGFLAAAQLLVYIGAISILIIFAIMMTRRLMNTTEPAFNAQWTLAIVASVVLLSLLVFTIIRVWGPNSVLLPITEKGIDEQTMASVNASVSTMGQFFVSADRYVLPFELASVLLLAALIGAIVIARPEKEE